jgi:hypothetical protein
MLCRLARGLRPRRRGATSGWHMAGILPDRPPACGTSRSCRRVLSLHVLAWREAGMMPALQGRQDAHPTTLWCRHPAGIARPCRAEVLTTQGKARDLRSSRASARRSLVGMPTSVERQHVIFDPEVLSPRSPILDPPSQGTVVDHADVSPDSKPSENGKPSELTLATKASQPPPLYIRSGPTVTGKLASVDSVQPAT